ncbi:hypothetical protein OOJ96_22575 [Pseudomonas sp. 15FMM2]|uniref:Uncharacterized protein n=1 Tax=Pseudomonas imrae TaxID=2992837 RepID=A0ACC7PIE1_9PSED
MALKPDQLWGLARDGGATVPDLLADTPPSRASPLPHFGWISIFNSIVIWNILGFFRWVEVGTLQKPIFIRYKVAQHSPFCHRPWLFWPLTTAQEMIHEPYRYRRRYPDGLFLGP